MFNTNYSVTRRNKEVAGCNIVMFTAVINIYNTK